MGSGGTSDDCISNKALLLFYDGIILRSGAVCVQTFIWFNLKFSENFGIIIIESKKGFKFYDTRTNL